MGCTLISLCTAGLHQEFIPASHGVFCSMDAVLDTQSHHEVEVLGGICLWCDSGREKQEDG